MGPLPIHLHQRYLHQNFDWSTQTGRQCHCHRTGYSSHNCRAVASNSLGRRGLQRTVGWCGTLGFCLPEPARWRCLVLGETAATVLVASSGAGEPSSALESILPDSGGKVTSQLVYSTGWGIAHVVKLTSDPSLQINDIHNIVLRNSTTVKPALVTTCIQRPPLFKDHLVVSQLWLYNAFLPLLRDHLYSKTTFFWPKRVSRAIRGFFRGVLHIFAPPPYKNKYVWPAKP